MSRRSVVCLVCGLLATCVFVFLAYRYLLASSTDTEAEHRAEKKQAEMSSLKVSTSGSIPPGVLSKIDDVSVLEKTATFAVNKHVRLRCLLRVQQFFCSAPVGS